MLMMGLRLAEGIDPARYAALAGRPLAGGGRGAGRARPAEADAGRLRVTAAGRPVLDAVLKELLVQ